MRRLVLLLMLVPLLAACQTMSVEEAKKVTASFSGTSFVPPPRTINDITAILDQQKQDPKVVAEARAKADQQPPVAKDPGRLADFYFQRGMAARDLGRTKQELGDLRLALEWAGKGQGSTPYYDITFALAFSEIFGGNVGASIGYLRQGISTIPMDRRGALIGQRAMLARMYALAGDFESAEAEVKQVVDLVRESGSWRGLRPEWIANWYAQSADVRARLAETKGRWAEAEALYREAIAGLVADPVQVKQTFPDIARARLAGLLARQGRLTEAEHEARTALRAGLEKRGRDSTHTASMTRVLAKMILAQGRFAEAETLLRAALTMYDRAGTPPDSSFLAWTREDLTGALVPQGRYAEALAEFEATRKALGPAYESWVASLGSYTDGDINRALALLGTNRPAEALPVLDGVLAREIRMTGDKSPAAAEIRGFRAVARARTGERATAFREFREATAVLLSRSAEIEEEGVAAPARDQRVAVILNGYIGLLADIHGTATAGEAGVDTAAEAFRLADVARGRSVQRALDAGAARAAAKTPALADLVRREQDAKKQVSALFGVLASAASQPSDKQDAKVLADLRRQIDSLRRAREALAEQIAKEFPAYAQLINPSPATVERVRRDLRPGEALVATYTTGDRTFVWAFGSTGPVAFAAAPLSAKALETSVGKIRKALDPSAQTFGDIPAFDLDEAHGLYRALLEPVAPGWRQAQSLLVVAHGPLGQIPLALLPTRPTRLGPERGALFANYREVPWLVRTHAVTVLPSVSSLATLRSLPPADPGRRPFIGFGDPYFSEEQARRAARRAAASAPETPSVPEAGTAGAGTVVAVRSMPVMLRSSPKTQGLDSSQLAMLPRLPETADEIRSMAVAMNADLTRDVFLGERANEQSVRTADLSGYRVVAFATHGLVPGDLDGLTQPALALSAPDVAKIQGQGVLTMADILGLRLNADWVVLSACNTASGQGAGSEAVSGLGRAFFYAGARALLVSNWPVETISAKALTTDLFRRQSEDRTLTRARALQATLNALIDGPGYVDPRTKQVVAAYAHPIFWAPFTLVGDGGN